MICVVWGRKCLAGNFIGKEFVVITFGESHGKCVGAVVDGCPAGLPFAEADVQAMLDKRIPKNAAVVSARVEEDKVEIISGIFNGFTTGAPIAMLVENKDTRLDDYAALRRLPRPGHADYPAAVKYGGFNDYRGGGRFSGRVTVPLVMTGALAKKLLSYFGVEVLAYTRAIGKVRLPATPNLENVRRLTYATSVRCPSLQVARAMEKAIVEAKAESDSLGGIVECVVTGVQAGVGEPFFDALDAEIAKLLFAIPGVKGVEFGAGFKAAELKGSENNDAFTIEAGKIVTLSNNAGGILGGLTTGMPIIVRVAFKPTSSIARKQQTVDLETMKPSSLKVTGRHDPCIVPKAVPVVESAAAIVLVDHMIRAGLMPKVLRGQK